MPTQTYFQAMTSCSGSSPAAGPSTSATSPSSSLSCLETANRRPADIIYVRRADHPRRHRLDRPGRAVLPSPPRLLNRRRYLHGRNGLQRQRLDVRQPAQPRPRRLQRSHALQTAPVQSLQSAKATTSRTLLDASPPHTFTVTVLPGSNPATSFTSMWGPQ